MWRALARAGGGRAFAPINIGRAPILGKGHMVCRIFRVAASVIDGTQPHDEDLLKDRKHLFCQLQDALDLVHIIPLGEGPNSAFLEPLPVEFHIAESLYRLCILIQPGRSEFDEVFVILPVTTDKRLDLWPYRVVIGISRNPTQ